MPCYNMANIVIYAPYFVYVGMGRGGDTVYSVVSGRKIGFYLNFFVLLDYSLSGHLARGSKIYLAFCLYLWCFQIAGFFHF